MTFLSAIQQLSAQQPTIPLIKPADGEFEATRACFVKRDNNAPGAIARPQNADHVKALVQFCNKNGVDFVVRSGGHDCSARSQVNGALSIDMRDIKYVRVAADKKTAAVGGGILFRDLTKALDDNKLVTAVGATATVGFIGWATLGGYGPFSTRYGMGFDQIVGAKLVNAAGELVEAGPDLLQGIRGGGGIFGIIVELTVKVYPCKGAPLLTSLIIYDPSDHKAAWTSYATGYEKLVAEKSIPAELQLQPLAAELPGLGKAFAISASWNGDDHDEGKKWFAKIAAFGKCIKNDPQPQTLFEYVSSNEKLVTFGSFGRVYTLNLRKYTTKTAEFFARQTSLLPGGGVVLLLPSYRASGSPPSTASVFPSREDHLVCELLCMTPVAELEAKGDKWARDAMRDIRESDPENVPGTAYVPLLGVEDSDYKQLYGKNYDTLVALKRKYDPDNIFKYAVPRLNV